MKFLLSILSFCILTVSVNAQSALWADYLKSNPRGQGSILANYSYAGYHYCEKELPVVTKDEYEYFNVCDFGAVPNDGYSDRVAVVNAIQAAKNYQGKAVVYFPEGRFDLNSKDDYGRLPIVVTKNNIVLKGAGQDVTELYFDQPAFLNSEPLIRIIPEYPYDSYWRGDDKLGNVTSYPEKGGFHLEVTNSYKFKPGMVVNIDADLLPRTERGRGYFTHHAVPEGVKDKEDYFFELHQVDRVEGNSVYFKEPIHLDLPHMENVIIREVKKSIEECGIEDMTLSGNYREQYKHHNGSRFGERFDMVYLKDARHCWIRNVRMKNYSSAIQLNRSIACSLFNINLVGHTGHNAVGGNYSYGNLFMFLRENTQTHHGFGGDHSFSGNVFSRCNQFDGIEAHCAWPRASLYDLNQGGFVTRPGGAEKFPHHGKDLCFWNWNVTKPGTEDFWPIGERYGYFMPPVIAGLHGEPFSIPDQSADLLAVESMGSKISEIESLFTSQLADRIGSVPQWLQKMITDFEAKMRHAGISISLPANYSTFSDGENITVMAEVPKAFPTTNVKRIELMMSEEGLYSGFKTIKTENGWNNKITFSTNKTGPVILKLVMYYSDSELEESLPVTIFIGNPDQLIKQEVKQAAMITHSQRIALYNQFVLVGGAEATDFPENKAFQSYKNGSLFYTVEKDFYQNQLETYKKFGKENIKPILETNSNIMEVNKLIDNNISTTIGNIYGSLGSMLEFDMGEEFEFQKMELVWNENVSFDVKLEVQTSSDSLAWYSFVNDEPLWDFGVQQIGQTLSRENLLPGSVTSIYIPKRKCRYVRLSAQYFPNGKLSEIRFFGKHSVTSSIVTEKKDMSDINLYPNPTYGRLYIDSGNEPIEKISIFDLDGRQLFCNMPNSSVIDISALKAGVYLIVLDKGNERKSFRIIKY